MFDHEEVHVRMYQVLDLVLSSRAIPPGAKGRLFSIIDDLRTNSSADEGLLRAERISIAVHTLESALRAFDEPAIQNARDRLKSLAVDWLHVRISGRELLPVGI